MSLKALPIVFINLSGEMMYILDQRLKAQNITKDKSDKVVNDIVSTMLSRQFVEELFKPQEIYSRCALRTVFEKLAHASIMRLNATSMDKLYDLMTMVFKYQICMCRNPDDILFVTLNHLDAIAGYVCTSPVISKQVGNVYSLLMENYKNMSQGELQLLRYTLLAFFQDLQIRVSVFLKDGSQHPNGRFVLFSGGPVPHAFQVPGSIKEYSSGGHLLSHSVFPTEDEYQKPLPLGTLEPEGYRGTTLGTNIYTSARGEIPASETISSSDASLCNQTIVGEEKKSSAFEELSLLARLIGKTEKQKQPEFAVGLFDDKAEDDSVQGIGVAEGHTVVNINVAKSADRKELSKILTQLTVEEKESDTNDILELLDAASM